MSATTAFSGFGRFRPTRVWRWLLVGFLTFTQLAIFTIAAGTASAATIQITLTPTNPTQADSLSWAFTGQDGATSCELERNGTVESALADCTSPAVFDVSALGGGEYTFTVFDAAAADVSGATPSSSLEADVTPNAPSITGTPTSPGTDTSPTWTFTSPAGADSSTCELDYQGSAVDVVDPCSSPFSPDLSSAANGTYTLSVTATAGGVIGPATTSSYDLEAVAAANTPTVTAPASPSNDTSPTFTIVGTGSDTLGCVFTDPTGATVFSGSCPGDGTFSTSGSPDGRYTLAVTETTSQGATATTTVHWTRDTVAPPVPTVSSPTSPSKDRQPVFTVTDTEPGVSYLCRVRGPDVVSVTSCDAATSLDLTSAADGPYTLLVQAVDNAGNVSASGSATYSLITAPPPAPAIVAPASPGDSTSPSFAISDRELGVTYLCSATDSAGNPVTVTACAANTNLDLSLAPQGAVTLTVQAVDVAGNVSPSKSSTYILDTIAPPAPVITGPTTPQSTLTATFGITDSEADTTLSCVLTSPGGRQVFGGTCPSPVSFDTTGFADGTYSLVVTATDPAGNATSTTQTWKRDTTAPGAPAITAPTSPGNGRTPVFTVTEADTSATLTCAATASDGSTVPVLSCGTTTQLNLANAPDGVVTLVVTATDAAGNATSATQTWTLDTTPPPAPNVGPSESGNIKSSSVTVSDTEPGVTYNCSVTGPGAAHVRTCGPNSTIVITGAANGAYQLLVTAVDAAGNASTTATSWTYTYDTVAPTAPAVSKIASPTNVVRPFVTITDPDGDDTLSCALTLPNGNVQSGGCPTNGVIDTTGDGQGTFSFTVRATDPAGNFSTTTITWVLDTTAPAAPDVRLAGSSPSNSLTPDFTVTPSGPGDSITCVGVSPTGADVPVVASQAGCSLNLVGFTNQGGYTLQVVETDAAGNSSAPGSATYVFDSIPPSLPSVSLTSVTPTAGIGNIMPAWSVTPGAGDTRVLCTLSGPTAVAQQVCGAATLSPTGLVNGSYLLSIVGVDAAGNQTSAVTSSYTLEKLTLPAPSLTVSATPGTVLSGSTGELESDNTRPTVTISSTLSDPNTTFACTIDDVTSGKVVGPVACPTSGPLDLDALGFSTIKVDDAFLMTATVTDEYGNTSPASSAASYRLLTIPPPEPVVTKVPHGTTPFTRQTFSWNQLPAGETAYCSVTPVPPSAGTTFAVQPCQDPLLLTLTKGTYQFSLYVVDQAGNTSAVNVSKSFVILPGSLPPPTVTPPKSPGRSVHPKFRITAPSGDVLSCTLTTGSTSVFTDRACPTNGVVDLSGRADGNYTLTVVATNIPGEPYDAATYTLDTTPPARPELVTRPHGSGTSVDWAFLLPANTSGECTVTSGGQVVEHGSCDDSAAYDLHGIGNGTYQFTAVAVDPAGNESKPLTVDWKLRADAIIPTLAAPTVGEPSIVGGTVVWPISDSGASSFVCSVTHGSRVVAGNQTCGSSFEVNLSGQPAGSYDLRVRGVSSQGVLSPYTLASYDFASHGINRGPVRSLGNRVSPTVKKNSRLPPSAPPKKTTYIPPPIKQVSTPNSAFGGHPEVPLAISRFVNRLGSTAGGAGFPLLLIAVVALFLLVQNRIDRRDPKLALATVGADDMVEFSAPPSLEAGP